jgi:hypothetical protein
MNRVLILDPLLASDFLSRQGADGRDDYYEVWEGRVVVPPTGNGGHQHR